MRVRFFGGPLDGAEVEHDEDLPPVLVFPDHDSWDIFTEKMWTAGHQQSTFYRLAHIVTSDDVLPEESHYRHETEPA
jgi:hypothetical protein